MSFHFIVSCLLFFFAAPLPASPESEAEVERITAGFQKLGARYYSPTLKIWLDRPGDDLRGHFEGRINPPWWSAANAVEAMVDFMDATGRKDFDVMLGAMHDLYREPMKRWPLVAAELEQRHQWSAKDTARLAGKRPGSAHESNFRNEYLDDSGWWGIAWLKMAERTHEQKFLATAEAIHAHMAAAWRPDLGGGVLWCLEPDKQKPNSITNQLFLILSARLAVQTKQENYATWARKAFIWIDTQKLYDGTGVVDAPGHQGDYWSYNQGTYLGGLLAWARLTKDPQVLNQAAEAAITILERAGFVTKEGIIQEKLGTSGWDGCLFKGIFARYLGQLRDALTDAKIRPDVVTKISNVLTTTATALHAHQATETGQYSADWESQGKNQERNFNTDVSALTALIAALTGK